jgi:hypothetical protein
MSSTPGNWPANLPPPGVSSTDGQGGHKSIEVDAPKRPASGRGKGRRRDVGDDVLKDVNGLRKEDSAGISPDGTNAVERDVRIGRMPKTKRPRRNMATFRSVDGEDYTFRTHDTKGKELPQNRVFALFVACREMALGGSPVPVFNAFKVKIKDQDGKQFFPFTEESLRAINGLGIVPDDEEEDEEQHLQLGEES